MEQVNVYDKGVHKSHMNGPGSVHFTWKEEKKNLLIFMERAKHAWLTAGVESRFIPNAYILYNIIKVYKSCTFIES